MKIIRNPGVSSWPELLARPVFDREDLTTIVADIVNAVKLNGDAALRELTKKFDGVEISDIEVSNEEIEAAGAEVPEELRAAISLAKSNIEKFHRAQIQQPSPVETAEGVTCWRKQVPIEKVGLYIPAGTAPLFSTVLMLAIPATIAGCQEIVLCSPPDSDGRVNPVVLYTAKLCGVTKDVP
jgi:histidinol dehydrogenase